MDLVAKLVGGIVILLLCLFAILTLSGCGGTFGVLAPGLGGNLGGQLGQAWRAGPRCPGFGAPRDPACQLTVPGPGRPSDAPTS